MLLNCFHYAYLLLYTKFNINDKCRKRCGLNAFWRIKITNAFLLNLDESFVLILGGCKKPYSIRCTKPLRYICTLQKVER